MVAAVHDTQSVLSVQSVQSAWVAWVCVCLMLSCLLPVLCIVGEWQLCCIMAPYWQLPCYACFAQLLTWCACRGA